MGATVGIEIERKFLVTGDEWRHGAVGTPYRQGYLLADRDRTVRVRTAGTRGYLTVKGAGTGLCRPEFEYQIPLADAEEMLATLCQGSVVEKVRYCLDFAGHLWEIDEFGGDNRGLLLAEIELQHEDQPFARPPWIGREVTGVSRYHNAFLSRQPYRTWPEQDR